MKLAGASSPGGLGESSFCVVMKPAKRQGTKGGRVGEDGDHGQRLKS